MILIEKALTTSSHQSPFEWFKSQGHLSLSRICQEGPLALYHEFLQELYQLYLKTNSEYYWFTKSGKLIGDAGLDVIDSNNIRLNKSLLRDIKLEEILKTN